MKKFLLLFLLIPSLCFAVEPIDFSKSIAMSPAILGGSAGAAAADQCAGYLICEGAEGSGTPAGWTNVTTNGTVNWDYTTTKLDGDNSLALTHTAAGWVGTWTSFAAQDTVYGFTLFRTSNAAPAQVTLSIQDGAGASLCYAQVQPTTAILSASCNANVYTVGALSADTLYYVWVRYTKGTGANGICSSGFSTDGTEPTSGDNFVSKTNCTNTAQAERIYLGGYANNATLVRIFDKVRIKTTAIGNNPD